MSWYQDEQYVQESCKVFSITKTIQEKIELMEYYRSRLYCKNPNKWRYFAIIINAILNDEEIHNLYELDMDAYHWNDRVYRKTKKTHPNSITLRPLEVYDFNIPVCYDTSEQEFGGLYFLGASYFVPTTKHPIYAVKIGKSDYDIGSRIKSYGTANPFIYHEKEHVLPDFICPTANEKTCHAFLSSIAVQALDKNTEWFIVNEVTYFKLCELFKDKKFFADVATGRIRAI